MLGANVVIGVLGSRETGPGSSELHDLVAAKLTSARHANWMAAFDAEAGTPDGPSGWARDRVQHVVATALAKDQAFATQVRSILESMDARG